MDDLYYNGSITEDIKKIKKVKKRNEELLHKIDIVYLIILTIYLIIILTRLINGEQNLPLINLSANTLIIIRNTYYIKFMSAKRKAESAYDRINRFIRQIYEKKEEANNQSAKISVDNIVDSLVIEATSDTKKYDDYNKLYEDIDELCNYIYFIDENERINLLKEIRTKIKKPHDSKQEKVELELVELEDQKQLPVKQVLKLKK